MEATHETKYGTMPSSMSDLIDKINFSCTVPVLLKVSTNTFQEQNDTLVNLN